MEGKRHLGAVIGSLEFKNNYVSDLVDSWVKQFLILSDIEKFYPQSAYCAFTAGFRHKLNYVIRTINNIEHLLEPVENAIRNKLIPSLCEGRSCNDLERDLLSLPVIKVPSWQTQSLQSALAANLGDWGTLIGCFVTGRKL
eukprot:gene3908-biopygen3346